MYGVIRSSITTASNRAPYGSSSTATKLERCCRTVYQNARRDREIATKHYHYTHIVQNQTLAGKTRLRLWTRKGLADEDTRHTSPHRVLRTRVGVKDD